MSFRSPPKIREEFRTVESEFFRTVSTMVVSAFGLVAALAWNTAITNILQRYLRSGSNATSWIIYAVVVTMLAVLVTIYIGRLAKRYDRSESTKESHQ